MQRKASASSEVHRVDRTGLVAAHGVATDNATGLPCADHSWLRGPPSNEEEGVRRSGHRLADAAQDLWERDEQGVALLHYVARARSTGLRSKDDAMMTHHRSSEEGEGEGEAVIGLTSTGLLMWRLQGQRLRLSCCISHEHIVALQYCDNAIGVEVVDAQSPSSAAARRVEDRRCLVFYLQTNRLGDSKEDRSVTNSVSRFFETLMKIRGVMELRGTIRGPTAVPTVHHLVPLGMPLLLLCQQQQGGDDETTNANRPQQQPVDGPLQDHRGRAFLYFMPFAAIPQCCTDCGFLVQNLRHRNQRKCFGLPVAQTPLETPSIEARGMDALPAPSAASLDRQSVNVGVPSPLTRPTQEQQLLQQLPTPTTAVTQQRGGSGSTRKRKTSFNVIPWDFSTTAGAAPALPAQLPEGPFFEPERHSPLQNVGLPTSLPQPTATTSVIFTSQTPKLAAKGASLEGSQPTATNHQHHDALSHDDSTRTLRKPHRLLHRSFSCRSEEDAGLTAAAATTPQTSPHGNQTTTTNVYLSPDENPMDGAIVVSSTSFVLDAGSSDALGISLSHPVCPPPGDPTRRENGSPLEAESEHSDVREKQQQQQHRLYLAQRQQELDQLSQIPTTPQKAQPQTKRYLSTTTSSHAKVTRTEPNSNKNSAAKPAGGGAWQPPPWVNVWETKQKKIHHPPSVGQESAMPSSHHNRPQLLSAARQKSKAATVPPTTDATSSVTVASDPAQPTSQPSALHQVDPIINPPTARPDDGTTRSRRSPHAVEGNSPSRLAPPDSMVPIGSVKQPRPLSRSPGKSTIRTPATQQEPLSSLQQLAKEALTSFIMECHRSPSSFSPMRERDVSSFSARSPQRFGGSEALPSENRQLLAEVATQRRALTDLTRAVQCLTNTVFLQNREQTLQQLRRRGASSSPPPSPTGRHRGGRTPYRGTLLVPTNSSPSRGVHTPPSLAQRLRDAGLGSSPSPTRRKAATPTRVNGTPPSSLIRNSQRVPIYQSASSERQHASQLQPRSNNAVPFQSRNQVVGSRTPPPSTRKQPQQQRSSPLRPVSRTADNNRFESTVVRPSASSFLQSLDELTPFQVELLMRGPADAKELWEE